MQVVAQFTVKPELYNASGINIGKGKLEDIAKTVLDKEASQLILDCRLSPSKAGKIEELLDCTVVDRIQLILGIFAQRARSREGKLQVELAQLRYMLPRLTGKGSSLSRLGGGIGTRGPGEKKLETDRRHVRQRIQTLERQIAHIGLRRHRENIQRKKSGIPLVAMVGYTNAGKTTLMNALSETESTAADQLFTTLDPLHRIIHLPQGHQAILVDTVGFIRELPHELIAAFRATLDEAKNADLLLKVLDASSLELENQEEAVDQVLSEIGITDIPTIVVLNKADQVFARPEYPGKGTADDSIFWISALKQEGLLQLLRRIEATLFENEQQYLLVIPFSDSEALAKVYKLGHRVQVKTTDSGYEVQVVLADEHLHLFNEYVS